MDVIYDFLLPLVAIVGLFILPTLLMLGIFKIYDHFAENNKDWIEVKTEKNKYKVWTRKNCERK